MKYGKKIGKLDLIVQYWMFYCVITVPNCARHLDKKTALKETSHQWVLETPNPIYWFSVPLSILAVSLFFVCFYSDKTAFWRIWLCKVHIKLQT